MNETVDILYVSSCCCWLILTLVFVCVCVCVQSNLPNKIDIKVTRRNVMEDSFRVITGIKNTDFLKTR